MTPSQLKNLTPADAEALKRLASLRAAQAARPALPGTPGSTGPPQPPAAPQGTVSRLVGNAANAGRTAAGVVGRGISTVGAKPLGVGLGSMLYSPRAEAGTLDSPEAQQAIAENIRIRRERGDPIVAGEPNEGFVNSPVSPVMPPTPGPDTAPLVPGSAITRSTHDIGDQQLRSYTTPQGSLAGMVPAGRGRGGFVGAATDAEAARNLQARAVQDQAARGIAQNTDRTIESMRDLRAEQMGIPRGRLDASEGRGGGGGEAIRGVTQNPFAMSGDSFGDDVRRKNKLLSAIENPEGKTLRQRTANQEAALGTFKAFMEGGQQPTQTTPGVNPLDAGRFLLDQEKFARQQGLDQARLGIDREKLEDRRAGTALEQRKYSDEQRAAFVENFSFPDENAPREQIAADAFNMSQATGGLVSPEVVGSYYAKVAKELGIDWKKGGPKNPMDLNQEVMKAIARDYGGK